MLTQAPEAGKGVVEKRAGRLFSLWRQLFGGVKLKSTDSNCVWLSAARDVDISEFSRLLEKAAIA